VAAGRVGVFGGTFDPVHIGHLIVAGEAAEALALDRVLWIPSADPPHKRGAVMTPARVRADMVRAAVADDPRFEVDELELEREGPSYTVDTLRALGERWPDAELVLLIGADCLRDMHEWRDPEGIARLARPVVLTRPGVDAPGEPVIRAETLEVSRIEISATALRARVREGRSLRYYVPDPVRRIIAREGLYGRG